MTRNRAFWAVSCLVLAGCSGCATFKDGANNTLNYAHTAGVGLRESVLPVITAVCEAEVGKCEALGDSECPKWQACAAVRRKIAIGFMTLQLAIMDANAAIAVGDETEISKAVDKVISVLIDIRKQLKEVGLL